MNLFDGTIDTLTDSLNYSSTKNRAIANNIANVDTPDYKAKQVNFKNVLNKTLTDSTPTKKTQPQHIDFKNDVNENYTISSKGNTVYNHNGNNVDMDKEMSDLAENQIYYQVVVDRLNGKFSDLQSVLRGGS